ncbi:hypothetical protein MMC10_007443 [Thelotrema lepadinum]|nr:hypothetical protein [Thelotrema lepadinum]
MIVPKKQIATLSGHNGPVHCVKFSAGSGQYVLTGASDRTVRLFNPLKAATETGGTSARQVSAKGPPAGLVQSYSAHGHEVLDIAVTSDNARFASVGGDRQVFLWDVAQGRTLKRWAGHAGRVNAVDFGGEGSVVVSGSYDATVRLWDCKSQSTKPIQIFDEAKDSVSSVHVSGHEIATGSVDGRVRLYDLRMGMMYVDVVGQPINSVQQTRDGNALLISTLDSTIRLFDKGNGQLLQSYKGHSNENYRIRSTLAFADAAVISGSEDGCIILWDLLDGIVLEKLQAHGGKVVSAVSWNSALGKKEWASAGSDGK